MGDVTAFRTPAYRKRHKICTAYLEKQDEEAWKQLRRDVLNELGLLEYVGHMTGAMNRMKKEGDQTLCLVTLEAILGKLNGKLM